ncbi:ATP-binding protein [Microbacterium oxydans]|uniref:ATP-binding protein n=1 Tax=Microbacterium oxydans TaxID=82380 RepID=UPI00226B1DC2|nr:ATP-binding protein [Microbacterium oxydans]WAA66745.1 ATP-binding protein [Microbacterium oxydans]
MTRESSTKEFKENFTWGSIGLYARTMAAFANARGGYIFFGITDNPRTVVGLSGKGRSSFDNLDQAKLTAALNELFSPEIHWSLGLIDLPDGPSIGVIYTFESEDKPLLARKSYQQQNAKISEGDIFYRYNSRSQKIRFPELKRVLEEAKARDQRAMMSHFEALVRAGASNAAVLDFSENTLQGPTGQKVLIDEKLLDQISFIKEGQFVEVGGAPTLKLVGELQPATAITIGTERVVRTALSSDDVLYDFLGRLNVGSPEQYIRQTATGPTGFLPVQFYRALAGMSHEELLEYVEGIATRSPAKRKLIDRLTSGDDMRFDPPATGSQYASTVQRRGYYEQLLSGQIDEISLATPRDTQRFLEAIKSLDDDQIRSDVEKLLKLMTASFDSYYATEANVADALRRAACRVDSAMFGAA